jgi:ergothioneine biosynthesis protein EgtB
MATRRWGDEADAAVSLAKRYRDTRALSKELIAPLTDADATVQSMADASPAKWHLAHVTWFFETFVLRDHVSGYRPYDDAWGYLFNSYYEAEGPRHCRARRGLLTRPSLWQILDYRSHVDEAILSAMPDLAERCASLIELGIAHEQQHQELLVTDLKHLFSCNPLGLALWAGRPREQGVSSHLQWINGANDLVTLGCADGAFAFDNEQPRYRHCLAQHKLANRPITNGEWLEFMEDGGYAKASLWLSDGWDWVNREKIAHPLYWHRTNNGWEHFTLCGWSTVDMAAPVSHISLYEADAFASLAGARLPTEQELESAALGQRPDSGVQLDRAGPVAPRCDGGVEDFHSIFGNVWEWSGSSYRPYPGFRVAPGAVGEYNGKFMSGQFVLKGGSCATPRGHMRATYRNFFYPHQRWQFTGLRLAKDA